MRHFNPHRGKHMTEAVNVTVASLINFSDVLVERETSVERDVETFDVVRDGD